MIMEPVTIVLKNGESAQARKLQQLQHRKLKALGQRVEVVHTKEQVDKLMAESEGQA